MNQLTGHSANTEIFLSEPGRINNDSLTTASSFIGFFVYQTSYGNYLPAARLKEATLE